LCDEALAFVEPMAGVRGLSVELVDVDSDRALKREYGLRIPVVLLNGEVVGEGRIDREEFSRCLTAATFRRL